MPRQTRIPGTERPRIREIDQAAESYREASDEASSAKDRETVAKDALIAAMKRYSVTEYVDEDAVPPIRVTLSAGPDKVKVKEVRRRPEHDDAPAAVTTTITLTPASGKAIRAKLKADADRILASSGDKALTDPKLAGPATRHKKAKTRSAKEIGAT